VRRIFFTPIARRMKFTGKNFSYNEKLHQSAWKSRSRQHRAQNHRSDQQDTVAAAKEKNARRCCPDLVQRFF
jgi:hypothetical protein